MLNLSATLVPQDIMVQLSPKGGHFVREDPAMFNAPFFSITSKEAVSMDPQQRWLLETSYQALENAGIPAEKAAGTDAAVFAASMNEDYLRIFSKDPDEAPTNAATGTSPSILANRLSWYFDLKGPSVQLNTACSSSMVAVDLACQALRSGQSSMALVAGSNMLLCVEQSLDLSSMNMLSPDSLCYSFDKRANGYARGEGVAVLVLKRLPDAIRDSDMIRAVIRASGVNQDGHTPGITQPSSAAQEDLILRVYKKYGLEFDSTRYVEAHGTGTQIGDSTEIKVLSRVFRRSHSSQNPLYVGSVKANIGHLEGCSGLASIIKCILILEKGIIPPNALFEKWNSKPTEGLRRVSINSFGFGGTNGHVVMDDAYHVLETLAVQGHSWQWTLAPSIPTSFRPREVIHSNSGSAELTYTDPATNGKLNGTSVDPTRLPGQYHLLLWSAKDEATLKRLLQQYTKYYETCIAGSTPKLEQLAYTLVSRRSIMLWKAFAVINSDVTAEAFKESLSSCIRSSQEVGISFIFTGQGAQYLEMGVELLQYPVYRSTLETIDKIFRDLGANWSLLEEMQHGNQIDRPEFSQPLCTALQIALVELLRSFHVVPAAVIGHSSGEIAAAFTIGAISLKSACKVAYHRGRLAGHFASSTTRPGAMMSVNMSEINAQTYLDRLDVSTDIACINSPTNVTLSGDEEAIDKIKSCLDQDGVFARKLKVGVAYHSPAMQGISTDYLGYLGILKRRQYSNDIVMISSVTGQRVTSSTVSKGQYWVDNLVSSVRFADAI
ncbi:hypothetical protein Hte_010259 [Hypoxylon texense]